MHATRPTTTLTRITSRFTSRAVARSTVGLLAAAVLVSACGMEQRPIEDATDGAATAPTTEPAPVDGESAPGDPDGAAAPDEAATPDTAAADDATSETAVPSDDDTAAPTTVVPASNETLAAGVPEVQAVVAAREGVSVSQGYVVALAGSHRATSTAEPTSETVAGWIVDLTRLERALDADAIRALGDHPALERIAAPVEDLDASTLRVIALLDPESGAPDYLGALNEVSVAITRWREVEPDVEAAWTELVAEWESEWERAIADWEQAWADAVAEWEAAWEAATLEWEAAWAEAVTEWEAAWEAAAADWEAAWAQAAAEWEQAWVDAAAEWEQAWEDAVEQRDVAP